jgi:hypothetical protein
LNREVLNQPHHRRVQSGYWEVETMPNAQKKKPAATQSIPSTIFTASREIRSEVSLNRSPTILDIVFNDDREQFVH